MQNNNNYNQVNQQQERYAMCRGQNENNQENNAENNENMNGEYEMEQNNNEQ